MRRPENGYKSIVGKTIVFVVDVLLSTLNSLVGNGKGYYSVNKAQKIM